MTGGATFRAYIIAGGKSKRFRQDKTLFEYRGKPLIQHVHDAIRPLFDEITVISNDTGKFDFLGIETRPDIIPDMGPIGGIYSALEYARGARAFILASDMPFLNRDFIRFMTSAPADYDIMVPHLDRHYEPLHAIYSYACAPHLKTLMESGEKQILKVYGMMNLRHITREEVARFDDPEKIFTNFNYLEDVK